MKFVLDLADKMWNLKFLTGYRTKVAQVLLAGLSVYQGAATSPDLIKAGMDLPDINSAVFATLMGYFALKVAQFAKEHQPS